jgi:hypothetical protein
MDWGELGIFLIITAVNAGIVWNKLSQHSERIVKLEDNHDNMRDNHQKIELGVTKDIGEVKSSVMRMETILSFMAQQQGIKLPKKNPEL